jgi:Fur family ferric uptake transcriptional regulator
MSSPRRSATIPTDDELGEQLRSVGLRRTKPRVAVLRYMRKVGRAVAHAEVAEALEKLELDRVSIYRVLVDLARVKVLTRSDRGDHVWRFELARADVSHSREHPHFVCVTCGTVACLPEEAVRIGAARTAPRAVRKGEVEVQLKGECDACASS